MKNKAIIHNYKVRKKNIINLVLNFILQPYLYIFFIINLPSLKLIYSSSLMNIGTLSALYLTGFLSKGLLNQKKILISVNSFKRLFIILWSVLWLFLFLSGFWTEDKALSFTLLVRYLIVYFMVIGGLLFVQDYDIEKIIKLQIIWGSLLSIVEITIGIPLNSDLGQNYLTIGLPIAASLLGIFGIFLWNKKIEQIYFFLLIIILNLVALSKLPGRSPILFPGIIILVYTTFFIINSLYDKSFDISKLVKKISLIILSFTISIYVITNTLSNFWITRFNRLLYSTEEEARLKLYKPAIEAILKNPFGYGLNGSENIIGFYPHNIFLEVFISGGILAIFFLILIIILYFFCIKSSLMKNSYLFSLCMITTYFFSVWNISFDLGSSYIPFTGIAILVAVSTQKNQKEV